jgi:hypothetical protein
VIPPAAIHPRTLRQRATRAAKRAKGECRECPSPAPPGRVMCALCARKDAQRTAERNRAKGQCRECPSPAPPGRARCFLCARKDAQRVAERNRARVAAGMCREGCGRPLYNALLCEACHGKDLDRQRSNPAGRESRKRRDQAAVAAGLCGMCRRRPARGGMKTCAECVVASRERRRARAAARRDEGLPSSEEGLRAHRARVAALPPPPPDEETPF